MHHKDNTDDNNMAIPHPRDRLTTRRIVNVPFYDYGTTSYNGRFIIKKIQQKIVRTRSSSLEYPIVSDRISTVSILRILG